MGEDADLIHVGTADVGKKVATGVVAVDGGPTWGGVHVPEDVGRVKNVAAAHELAHLETKVRAAEQIRQNRENELANGITQEEMNNLAGMDVLLSKYPAAFMADEQGNPRFRDEEGHPFIVTRQIKGVQTLVVTQKGAVEFSNDDDWRQFKATAIDPIDVSHMRPSDIPVLGRFAAERAEHARILKAVERQGLSGLKTQDGEGIDIRVKDAYQVSQNPDQIRQIAENGQKFFRGEVIKPAAKPDFLSRL